MFGDPELQRLAGVSVRQIYNLRRSAGYRKPQAPLEHTLSRPNSIGNRRKAYPKKRPGHLQVDAVTQAHRAEVRERTWGEERDPGRRIAGGSWWVPGGFFLGCSWDLPGFFLGSSWVLLGMPPAEVFEGHRRKAGRRGGVSGGAWIKAPEHSAPRRPAQREAARRCAPRVWFGEIFFRRAGAGPGCGRGSTRGCCWGVGYCRQGRRRPGPGPLDRR